ncbi:hypothetical protein LCGC14_2368000 [marine sediment metagenome]|uniref:PH domain-containing protein n=1 Tax=marine sediment metagenome TaxID=412755 RepID=A0A0F9C4H6_9ZZZZ
MTTRLEGLIVIFDDDIREDDAENWIKAIRMMRKVARVEPIESTITESLAMRTRIATVLQERFNAIVDDLWRGKLEEQKP